ncbi:precorrin-4 C(11)-methyltransferase [Tepidanaerobacter acetatoxydans]|uniref:precorrin-4 C(11)-methyltransferase n=1 Tax=Tepidanaerobacter acetatoxydans TaxID=499229 RepID=UPI001BD1D101
MIYFIGAGPGDVELITVKGKKLLESCDVVIYAGSLVNPELLKYAKDGAKIYNSAAMNLEEIIDAMKNAFEKGADVARLHTGDPSIYGAIREQMEALDKLSIPYEVIPGVSSFSAASAVLKRELTVPGQSQTIILTRVEGRTPVPEEESLKALAQHKATMAIFLSINQIEKIAGDLAKVYGSDAPIVVVYKATWEDQKIVEGTLSDIAEKVKEAGICKTALILVGNFLSDEYDFSCLYNKTFSHEYR